MRGIQYRRFSLTTHEKNLRLNRASVCQFELTFRCGLHCKHCYTDCYNKRVYIKKELKTGQIKLILDKIHKAGVIWLCFTGGDPLTRSDFPDIYSYAKDKGFIITVFTNGYSMTDKVIKHFEEKPPFVIEITLNAVTEDLYERISRVEGSFVRVMKAINLILEKNLPLKIKTQITKDNFEELPKIENFTRTLGLQFTPSHILDPRLDGDLIPCNLRVSPYEVLSLNKGKRLQDKECDLRLNKNTRSYLFHCAIGGGDSFFIGPYGDIFLCNLIRAPKSSLLEKDVEDALNRLLPRVREKKFRTASKCKDCSLRKICYWCPGRAYLEHGDMEKPIKYYCTLAELQRL